MYINDTHILIYIVFATLGLAVGQFVDRITKKVEKNEKIFSTDIFRTYKTEFRPNYILMILVSLIYVGLIYKFGVPKKIIGNLNLLKYMILSPLLIAIFRIDKKEKIIPNRIILTIFEVGILMTFLYGFSNIAITIDMLLGMIVGSIIFIVISLIGKWIMSKETMGIGDIKLIGTLGLYFGVTNIVVISVLAALMAAIYGIILVIFKKKNINEYIAFGPFIVIAAFITIFVPSEIIINLLKIILTLGMYKV